MEPVGFLFSFFLNTVFQQKFCPGTLIGPKTICHDYCVCLVSPPVFTDDTGGSDGEQCMAVALRRQRPGALCPGGGRDPEKEVGEWGAQSCLEAWGSE